jgi:hypothetical protein
MRTDFNKKKRFFFSVVGAAGVNILRFNPAASSLLDAAADFVASFLPAPLWWVGHVILFTVVSLAIYLGLQTKLGTWLYRQWKKLEDLIGFCLRQLLGRRKTYFSEEERSGKEFKRDMATSIQSSPFVFCLLFAGYTMVYDEREQFLLNALLKLTADQKAAKDIRFLFLNRDSEQWKQRASLMVEHNPHLKDLGEYRRLCEAAEVHIHTVLPKAKIAFYDALPSWRLHIFEDHLFVSYYSGPPDSPFIDGHLTSAVAFNADTDMYKWLYGEFRRRWPDDWQDPRSSSDS